LLLVGVLKLEADFSAIFHIQSCAITCTYDPKGIVTLYFKNQQQGIEKWTICQQKALDEMSLVQFSIF